MKDYLNYTGDFSDLSRKDLEYLFILLENYKIRYRKNLEIPNNLGFGLEFEFENVLLYYVKKEMSKTLGFEDWHVYKDKSCSYQIDGFDVGGEVVSPILYDTLHDWELIGNILSVLRGLKADITDNTSFHVHIGAQIFKEDIKYVIRFVKVWSIFEHVIFKFAFGNSGIPRTKILEFAHPIAEEIIHGNDYVLSLDEIRKPLELSLDKTKALNLSNYHNLFSDEEVNNDIEIRCANGTFDKNIVQNTVNFYIKLMLYCVSDKYDEKLINRLFDRLKSKEFKLYQQSYAKDAVMLVDMIFDHSLDKINFLKQYIKQGEVVFVR